MEISSGILPVLLFILSSSASMNAIGLYLLHKDGRSRTNQNIILKFLSGCEFVVSVVSFLRWVLILHGSTTDDRIYQIVVHTTYASYLSYTFVMVFMTLDRFIATKYPLRYSTILSRRKAKISLFSSVIICGAIVFISLFVDYTRYNYVFDSYVFPFTSATAAICIVLTYTYILIKLRRRHARALQDNVSARRYNNDQRLVKMVAIISATFMVCFLVPDIMFALMYGVLANINRDTIFIIWYLGFLVDPITYIFMQKRLRDLMFEMLCFRRCRRNTNSTRSDSVAVISGNRSRVVETRL